MESQPRISGPVFARVSPRSPSMASAMGPLVVGIETPEKSRVFIAASASISSTTEPAAPAAFSGNPTTRSPRAAAAVAATSRYARCTASALAEARIITRCLMSMSSSGNPIFAAARSNAAGSSTSETRIVGQMPAENSTSRRGLDFEARISGMLMRVPPARPWCRRPDAARANGRRRAPRPRSAPAAHARRHGAAPARTGRLRKPWRRIRGSASSR